MRPGDLRQAVGTFHVERHVVARPWAGLGQDTARGGDFPK
jgi:hypothetical protein